MSKKYDIPEMKPQMANEPTVAYNTVKHIPFTPSLAKKIEKARKDFAEGRYTECKTKEELEAFLEAL